MIYRFREVKKNEWGHYDYNHSRYITSIVGTSDLLNVLNIMKDTKAEIDLHEYDESCGDEAQFTYSVIKTVLTLMESYYEEPDYYATIYVIDPLGGNECE